MADEAYKLASQISGDVRFDRMSRLLYSTDASMYQIEPMGVVLPKSKADVKAAIAFARETGVSIIPRGGGTGLAGGVVGPGLVMDMSKHMNRVLEVNVEERWVRVEPGVVLDELNAILKPHGLQFAPDVATGSRATIGGMASNNSAGAHSVLYGKTIDHVIELDVVFSDGSEATLGELDEAEVEKKCALQNAEGQAYRETIRISRTHADEISRRYPKILRRVGGYNLDEFIKKQRFSLARMVIGSEGTLATITSAKLSLVQLPKVKVLAFIHFQDLIESMRAVAPILSTQPAAIELIDKMILDQTKASLDLSSQRAWVQGDPAAVLAVEYYGDELEALCEKIDALEALMVKDGLGYAFGRATSESEQAHVWNVRKAGLGLLMGVKGDPKPVAFVEDQAVSPEKLPAYITEFESILEKYHTKAGYYAHASVGLLHIRPMVNLKDNDDIQKMRAIAEDVRDLVMKYGGAISGEHGDGLVRSCWNEAFFGSVLYGAFKEVKKAFDPSGMMNPGKIVDAPMMTENLRYGPTYQSHDQATHFDFQADGGFHRAIEMCNGVGACRKKDVGTMCPSYMATLEEEHSTRGRANALRAAISGQWAGGLTDKRMYDVMDLCLECKACKSECPSNVDMAKIKYEFLAQYYKKHGRPLRAVLFGHIETLSKLGCLIAPLSNWFAGLSLTKFAMKRLGIAQNRSLPPFATETFPQWFAKRRAPSRDKKVVLFHDTYMNYNHPEIGQAATKFLEAAGYEVLLAVKRCCGRPLLSSGYIERVKENALANVAHLHRYVEQGYPIVGFEPSCVSMLRDDYCDLIGDPRAKIVAEHIYTFEDFVSNLAQRGELDVKFSDKVKTLLLHGHCHQKALWGMTGALGALALPKGYDATAIAAGCCGMAGSFGYEAEHYDVSIKVGESRLMKAVRSANPETEVVASGLSCRQQILHATGKRAKHPAEILWEAVEESNG
jgi:FAD/FMN-containing dehydrogenase/Fe-S oxidoreductase